MSRKQVVGVGLCVAVILVVYCGQRSSAIDGTVEVRGSKLVGKYLDVDWVLRENSDEEKYYHVDDCDVATGMLCLTSVINKDRTIWIHPSICRAVTPVADKQVKDWIFQHKKAFMAKRIE